MVFELELEPSLPQEGELGSPVRHQKISPFHEGQLRPPVRHQKISLPREEQLGPLLRHQKSKLPQKNRLGPPVRHQKSLPQEGQLFDTKNHNFLKRVSWDPL